MQSISRRFRKELRMQVEFSEIQPWRDRRTFYGIVKLEHQNRGRQNRGPNRESESGQAIALIYLDKCSKNRYFRPLKPPFRGQNNRYKKPAALEDCGCLCRDNNGLAWPDPLSPSLILTALKR
jgi:hypothetical protein